MTQTNSQHKATIAIMNRALWVVLFFTNFLAKASAEDITTYQKPPKEIAAAINQPLPPAISVSPTKDFAVLMEAPPHPSIAELAEPMARLAGLRIDLRTNGRHLARHFTRFELMTLPEGKALKVSLPPGPCKLSVPVWSPDGKHFAFTNTTANGIDLWVEETANGQSHKIPNVQIDGTLDGPGRPSMEWLSDNRTLLARLVPSGRGAAPVESVTPLGPHVQQGTGKSGPVRTYEDMLANPHDEELFDYYCSSQLAYIDALTGKTEATGKPGIFVTAKPSPDAKYVLVAKLKRPYSYLHPFADFPAEVEIWNKGSNKVKTIASLPLADKVPIDGVRTGPRAYEWLPARNASLVWVEAMDGGNPKEKATYRDRMLRLDEPFAAEPVELTKLEQRFMGVQPLANGGLALVEDYERNKRWLRTFAVDLKGTGAPGKLLFARNAQDRYKDQGSPVMEIEPNGQAAVKQDGDAIFLEGAGASPEGDRPFLDRYDIATGKSERIFQSSADSYEAPEQILDAAGKVILTRKETPSDPPNYYVRTGGKTQMISHYTDPLPKLRQVKKQLVKYQREDGVQLSFTLYLPPDYKEGTKLPTFVWAYPYEYNDASTAGQVSGSVQRYTQLSGHLLIVLGGYAVLENAAMPIIGDPETVNNTYLEQIVMDAKAAIAKAAEMGVTDPQRVAVGGHSYGAFMTGNLLAHSDLFRAGIAESGAYNRTLTPFGFQTERRTLWEVPDLYIKMSPLMSANTIKAPLLLIHGEADDNPGTFPINSERLYQAVRGNGGTVRLVMLPFEAHGYAATETLEHVLWEELHWLDEHLAAR
jgi:dipeptidyl aminopeptidase/acylaminoacyl peptidase